MYLDDSAVSLLYFGFIPSSYPSANNARLTHSSADVSCLRQLAEAASTPFIRCMFVISSPYGFGYTNLTNNDTVVDNGTLGRNRNHNANHDNK